MPDAILAAAAASTNPTTPAEAQEAACTSLFKAMAAGSGAESLGQTGDSPARLLFQTHDLFEKIHDALSGPPLDSDTAHDALDQVYDLEALIEAAHLIDEHRGRRALTGVAFEMLARVDSALDRLDWPKPVAPPDAAQAASAPADGALDAAKVSRIDELSGALAQAAALMHAIAGDEFVAFSGLAEVAQPNYLRACSDLVNKARGVALALDVPRGNVDFLNALDGINVALAQAWSSLTLIEGEGFKPFAAMNDQHQQNILSGISELVDKAKGLAETLGA